MTKEAIQQDATAPKLDYVAPPPVSEVAEEKAAGENDALQPGEKAIDSGEQKANRPPADEELDPRQAIAKRYAERNYGKQAPEDADPAPEQPEEAPAAAATPSEPELVEVKINGLVRKVEKAKVDAAGGVEIYQKQVAANEGLRELSEARKRQEAQIHAQLSALKQKEEQLAKREAALKAAPAAAGPSTPDGHQSTPKDLPAHGDLQKRVLEKARKHREALFDGDEEEADKLFAESILEAAQALAQQPQPPATQPLDPNQLRSEIRQTVTQELTASEFQKELDKANAMFKSDYAEIASDRYLYKIAQDVTDRIAEEHPTWSPEQVLRAGGDEVKDWATQRGLIKAKPATSSKLDEKRSMSTPRAGTGRQAPPPPRPQQTRSGYVQQLREQRGLE